MCVCGCFTEVLRINLQHLQQIRVTRECLPHGMVHAVLHVLIRFDICCSAVCWSCCVDTESPSKTYSDLPSGFLLAWAHAINRKHNPPVVRQVRTATNSKTQPEEPLVPGNGLDETALRLRTYLVCMSGTLDIVRKTYQGRRDMQVWIRHSYENASCIPPRVEPVVILRIKDTSKDTTSNGALFEAAIGM